MQINADFTQPALVHPQQHQWVASPQAGVERIMLDRTGAERGRATSIVRYAPDSRFPHHQHPAGEEILVLSGVFSEGDHHYPQGWYLRNPAGSGHAPHSAEGAVIFVKLGHLPPPPMPPLASRCASTPMTRLAGPPKASTQRASCTATPTSTPGCCGWRPTACCPYWPHGKPKPSSSKAACTAQPANCPNAAGCACRQVPWQLGTLARKALPCSSKALHPTPPQLEPHAADLHDLYAHRHPRWGPQRPAGSPCSASSRHP